MNVSIPVLKALRDYGLRSPFCACEADWSTVDPWFNFRATKYLTEHGFYKFWDWFDDRKALAPALVPIFFLQMERVRVLRKRWDTEYGERS